MLFASARISAHVCCVVASKPAGGGGATSSRAGVGREGPAPVVPATVMERDEAAERSNEALRVPVVRRRRRLGREERSALGKGVRSRIVEMME